MRRSGVPLAATIGLILPFIVMVGCAYIPHEVTLDTAPPSPVNNSQIGVGSEIAIDFIDDRGKQTAGQRGLLGADIRADNILAQIRQIIVTGFEDRGFTVVADTEQAPTRIDVYLRRFEMSVQQGFWTGAENTFASIRIEGLNEHNERFREVYTNEDEERIMFVSFGHGIDEKMNSALAEVVKRIFDDKELMNFLIEE